MTLRGIQIIRAVAAMMVVFFHIGRLLLFKTGLNITQLSRIGAAGVDLFFVVSGFIMIYTTSGREFSLSKFLLLRIKRIVPLYWIVTILIVCLSIAMPFASSLQKFSELNIATSFVFVPSYNLEGQIFPPLVQGWTLVYEMFFYVCLAVVSKFLFRIRIPVLVAVFSILVLAGIVWPVHSAAVATYTDPILFEFLMGCVIAELLVRNKLRFGPTTVVTLITIGGVALMVGLVFPEPTRLRVLYWGIPAFLIVLGIVRAEEFFDFASLKIGNAIGDSSYSLYLTHGLVLSALGLFFRITVFRVWGGLPFALLMLLGCLIAGWVCWRFVERPLAAPQIWRRRTPTS